MTRVQAGCGVIAVDEKVATRSAGAGGKKVRWGKERRGLLKRRWKGRVSDNHLRVNHCRIYFFSKKGKLLPLHLLLLMPTFGVCIIIAEIQVRLQYA